MRGRRPTQAQRDRDLLAAFARIDAEMAAYRCDTPEGLARYQREVPLGVPAHLARKRPDDGLPF